MQDLGPKEWISLVKRARIGNEGLQSLLSEVKPILFNIARSWCPRLAEDLLQAGLIKVWLSLGRVDLNRSDSIRNVLVTTGVYGMRDELRRNIRRERGEVEKITEETLAPLPVQGNHSFKGLLSEYEEYIRATGDFAGAHQYMAKKKRMTITLTRKRFHQAVKEFAEREGK